MGRVSHPTCITYTPGTCKICWKCVNVPWGCKHDSVTKLYTPRYTQNAGEPRTKQAFCRLCYCGILEQAGGQPGVAHVVRSRGEWTAHCNRQVLRARRFRGYRC